MDDDKKKKNTFRYYGDWNLGGDRQSTCVRRPSNEDEEHLRKCEEKLKPKKKPTK